jgi:hypothetical protein
VPEILVEVNPAAPPGIPVHQYVVPTDIPVFLPALVPKTDGFYALEIIVQNLGEMLIEIRFMIHAGRQIPDMIGNVGAVDKNKDANDIARIIPNRKTVHKIGVITDFLLMDIVVGLT